MPRKKVLLSLVIGIIMLSLVACGGGDAEKPTGEDKVETAGLTEPIAESPILLTSGGQSADYQMVATMLNNLAMEYTANNVATSADLGGNKTLIVAVGGSSKGLGAAGIDADGEITRLTELLEAADTAEMSIIVLHIGGAARRGDLSDKFIEPAFSYADYALVVESGDADGKISGICAAKEIPLDYLNGIGDVAAALAAAFK